MIASGYRPEIIRLRLPSRKLSPRYIGNFPITKRVNEVTYQLQLPDHYRISPTFHVSLLKSFTNPLLPSSSEHEVSPPPPEVEVSEAIYRVKEILDSWRRGGRIQYLIDWEGYDPEERSWADKDDILDPSLISTKSIPIALLPGGVVALTVNQEEEEEGVMSHSHQRNQPPTHAHSHLITDHPHLHPLTGTTFKHTPLTHSSASLKVASYSLVTVYLFPRICRSAVYLPRKGRVPR